jgi:hypothetical protein
VDDGGLRVDEAGVEVAFEHGEDALDVWIGWRFGEKSRHGLREQRTAQSKDGRPDKVATLHVHLVIGDGNGTILARYTAHQNLKP